MPASESVTNVRPALIRPVAFIATAGAALLAAGAFAQNIPGGVSGGVQTPVGGAPFLEAWVDPEIAAFNLAQVPPVAPQAGCPDRPFRTIQAAITELRSPSGTSPFPPASPQNPGLVHVMPGVYGPAAVGGNGEFFPIRMSDNVSVQGYSAKACIIRGDQMQATTQAFVPFVALGGRAQWEALTDFSFLTDPQYVEFMEGFTFEGGKIQLYCEPEEIDVDWRVSNCVFDMLDYSDVGVPGPEFGILIVHVYDADWITVKGPKGEPIFVGGYHDARAHILNNTFVHGWQPGMDADIVTSSRTSVAICDVADTLYGDPMFPPPAIPDPISPLLRGVGNPNIQNNLIRALDVAPRTALLGIDRTDTTVVLASPPPAAGGSPSDAFDPTQAVSTNGTYNSLIVQSGVGPGTPLVLGAVPRPAVIPNANQGGRDPGFVGEMLGQFLGLQREFARDWRILVTSTLFDAGFAPNAQGFLGAANGTFHDEGVGILMPAHRAFDFDGEGYGNERNRFSRPDIGFDELDLVAMAGAYANDTLLDPEPAATAGVQCPNVPAMPGAGSGMSPIAISPIPASMFFAQTTTNRPYTTFGIPFPTLCQAGPALSATSAPAGSLVPSFANLVWIDGVLGLDDFLATSTFYPSFGGYTPTSFLGNFSPLNDPAAVFPINALKVPAQSTGWGTTCIVTVEQAHWIPSFGGPGFFTNLQTTFR